MHLNEIGQQISLYRGEELVLKAQGQISRKSLAENSGSITFTLKVILSR